MIRTSRPSHWVSDKGVKACASCLDEFSVRKRKHHCRYCGQIFCADCTTRRLTLPSLGLKTPSRVCEGCYTSLTNDDKNEIEEALDAKDVMISLLKRALHQKVLLLDHVKLMVTEIIEEAPLQSTHLALGECSPKDDVEGCGDDDDLGSEVDNETGTDESIETYLANLKEVFRELCEKVQNANETEERLVLQKIHLEEELTMRVVYSTQTERGYQQQIAGLRTEVQRLQDLVARMNGASSEACYLTPSVAPISPGHPSQESMCESLRRAACWPIDALFHMLHPAASPGASPSPNSRLTRDLIVEKDRTLCCRRRRRIEDNTTLLNDTLL
eukprot:Protomagalhaensia_sp_Gyna_25__4030@NODE_363_length_3706_cov_111_268885_g280_i0_p2_GENE_NODE_363_length_3706_cov_111_268885_g280_i0NODE_363_length_3706_cov_111_268885_g280_i0_p2_ORF_typecomplete_len329_score46_52FYVE/PF01363_21/1_8e20FYVE_2/PF02318_16/0_00026FYVE_2/PF02318_16/1_1e03DUF3584/PF12128_8/0_0026CCDC158/PF15921_5/0_12zfCRD/PF17979_1/0_13zfCRD/PF17979_1/1_7e02C1_4/PF07975_12/4_5C1_4/PF07975_12/7_1e02C1_4/PF07975_12/1_6e03HMMR_N/PF15905_5/22HMMR_N/PF15905_5/1_3zfRING_2/PF13639_6/0_08zfRIN